MAALFVGGGGARIIAARTGFRALSAKVGSLLTAPTRMRKTNHDLPLLSAVHRSGLQIQKRWLPLCTVETSVEKGQVSADILPGLSKLISETLNKPEEVISITLHTEVASYRAGSTEPNAAVHIWSIGVFDEQRNPGYSKVFVDYLAPRLNVPADRIVMFFHPITKTDAGHLLYADQKK